MVVRASETVELVPWDQLGRPEGERITYHLKPATLYERAKFRRALVEHGARRAPGFRDLSAELRRGIEALLPGQGDAQARVNLLGLVDAYDAALDALAASPGAPEAREAWAEASAALDPIVEQVRAGWPAYARLEADRQWYDEVGGIEGARLFLVGWTGFDAELVRGVAGVPEDVIALIPEAHLAQIAWKVAELLTPSEASAKNSDSPSPSPSSPATSTAKNPRRSNGHSTATPGT